MLFTKNASGHAKLKTVSEPTIPRVWLQEQFNKRRAKNRFYSLRSFAKFLGISSGRLSELLSGKRPLTPKLATRIADKLCNDLESREHFLKSVSYHQKKRVRKKSVAPTSENLAFKVFFETIDNVPYQDQQLDSDSYHIMSDPNHLAVLHLIETTDFKPDFNWIGRRLSISAVEARSVFERLLRMGFIWEEGSQVKFTQKNLCIESPPFVLREGHRKRLEQAIESIEGVEPYLRDITCITAAVDVKKLPQAVDMIERFRRKLCTFLEEGEQTEVYNLCVQLFPVTQRTTGKKSEDENG